MKDDLTHEQRFVKQMLESAEKKDEEKKILLVNDVDGKEVEDLVKEIQNRLIGKK